MSDTRRAGIDRRGRIEEVCHLGAVRSRVVAFGELCDPMAMLTITLSALSGLRASLSVPLGVAAAIDRALMFTLTFVL